MPQIDDSQHSTRAHFPPRRSARRRSHHGAAVAGIAPRLRRHRRSAGRFPKRFAVVFMGCGINENHWSAEGTGADMKLSKTLSAAGAVEAEDQRDRRPLHQGAHRPGHSSRADRQPALRRAHSEGRHHPFGRQRGSDDRQSRRPGHAAIQHRAGLRAADDRLPRDQFLPGLQLAHLLADARIRRCRWKSIRRWPSTACSRIAAACATSAFSTA